MNEIEVNSLIKRNKLDEKNYLKSLLDQGFGLGLLNENDLNNIQIQLLELLDKIVYKYNGIESSSIRKEILEQISDSNMYTIGIYLKTFNNPDMALESIKKDGIISLYNKGRKKIDRLLDIIRIQYLKVKNSKLEINNETYNSTLFGGINGFLKVYDPDFNAQDMKITADYPLYNNLIGKLDGVEFINEYLKSILLENEFCNQFLLKNIRYLLLSYSENINNLIINIFQIILTESIGCILADKNYIDLKIENENLNNIYNLFEGKSKDEIYDLVYNSYTKITIQNTEIKQYIEKGLNQIQSEIYNSFKLKQLDKVFIKQKYID